MIALAYSSVVVAALCKVRIVELNGCSMKWMVCEEGEVGI